MDVGREEREAASAAGRVLGRLGGRARRRALSPDRRLEIARKAIATRWANWQAKVQAGTPPVAQGTRAANDYARTLAPALEPLLAAGTSLTGIAADFNARGIPTRGGRRWSASTILRLIKRWRALKGSEQVEEVKNRT